MRLLANGVAEVTPLAKRAYARLSAFDLPGPTGATPVSVMVTRTAQGLARAFEAGAAKGFAAPEPPSRLEIAALDGLVRELLADEEPAARGAWRNDGDLAERAIG